MSIEKELKLKTNISELHKAHINILFTSGYIGHKISLILKPYNISIQQFNVLRILRGAENNRLLLKDIASRMIDRSSNVSRIVDKLEQYKHITRKRSKKDGRASDIILTKDGLELVNAITESVQNDLNAVLNLSETEAENLNNILDKARVE